MDPVCPVSLASFDHVTSSWKTSLRCFIEDWMPFSDPWPRSGMMLNGIAYQLPTLAPLTYGTGFGSSPTHSIPTPTASDHIERKNTTGALNFATNKAVSLDRWVKMWPTPTVKGNHNRVGASSTSGDGLSTAVKKAGSVGALNPTWVEWLMGFPIGHTDLSNSETP